MAQVDRRDDRLLRLLALRLLRQTVAVVALACSAWASVVDNPAVCCPDELSQQGGGRDHGTPPGSNCCLMAPCRTPAVSAPPAATVEPVSKAMDGFEPVVAVLRSIDVPAPPTPPPTSLDLA